MVVIPSYHTIVAIPESAMSKPSPSKQMTTSGGRYFESNHVLNDSDSELGQQFSYWMDVRPF